MPPFHSGGIIGPRVAFSPGDSEELFGPINAHQLTLQAEYREKSEDAS